MVSSMMPPTSKTPLIGTYFSCIMVMVACSVVCTILILNYHKRTVETHDMPEWVETIFLKWLPWLLRMDHPGTQHTLKSLMMDHTLRNLERGEKQPSNINLPDILHAKDDFIGITVTYKSDSIIDCILSTTDSRENRQCEVSSSQRRSGGDAES